MVKRPLKRGVREGVAVIGAGNWGSSLAAGVAAAGISLVEVTARRRAKKDRELGDAKAVAFDDAALDAEVLWICVPDGEIARVAERIAAQRGDLRGQIVVHSSGALTIEVLEAVRRAGALVAGVAPVFTFPTREPVALDGVLFAVEARPRSAAWRKLAALVRRLGGQPLRISQPSKVMYHAAATMASPLLASALHAAVATARKAGLGRDEAEAVVKTLAAATVRNYFEKGPKRSFSGAFARGDVGTVELHLRALLEHPNLHQAYLGLARNAAVTLPVREKAALHRLLRDDKRTSGA
jgi:predicted short-subunit dehydrogenase-like oxidoreductase (DUF2520 family)